MSKLLIFGLLIALVVVIVFSTISQLRLLLLSNFLYGVIIGVPIGIFISIRYAKKRYNNNSTRL